MAVQSQQFSQEAELGKTATYDLNLELYSGTTNTFSLEVLNLLDIAELVLLAMNERKESRGQLRREDYPFTNPALNAFLIFRRQDSGPVFRWERPRLTAGSG